MRIVKIALQAFAPPGSMRRAWIAVLLVPVLLGAGVQVRPVVLSQPCVHQESHPLILPARQDTSLLNGGSLRVRNTPRSMRNLYFIGQVSAILLEFVACSLFIPLNGTGPKCPESHFCGKEQNHYTRMPLFVSHHFRLRFIQGRNPALQSCSLVGGGVDS